MEGGPQGAPALVRTLMDWYDGAARDLPWRRPGVSPWGVLVSEVMLQQTPVARVIPAWERWLRRWPSPADLAAAEAGDAIREWDRLGYPRRALRLHAAATTIVDRHGGRVPSSVDELEALPGVGAYTARAVAAFAHKRRSPVADTNVRRVLARVFDARHDANGSAATAAERQLLDALLPADGAEAARASVALMELGALVCTARRPRCADCPVRHTCAWVAAGSPPGVQRRAQTYAGTDRQARGRLLAVLRDADGPVGTAALDAVWSEAEQRERALAGLLTDGLVERTADGRFRLPGVAVSRPG